MHLSVGAEREAYDDQAPAHSYSQACSQGDSGGRGGGGGIEQTPLLNRTHTYFPHISGYVITYRIHTMHV